MDQIMCFDWLIGYPGPYGKDSAILSARDYELCREKLFFIPYNKSFFGQACLVKMARFLFLFVIMDRDGPRVWVITLVYWKEEKRGRLFL